MVTNLASPWDLLAVYTHCRRSHAVLWERRADWLKPGVRGFVIARFVPDKWSSCTISQPSVAAYKHHRDCVCIQKTNNSSDIVKCIPIILTFPLRLCLAESAKITWTIRRWISQCRLLIFLSRRKDLAINCRWIITLLVSMEVLHLRLLIISSRHTPPCRAAPPGMPWVPGHPHQQKTSTLSSTPRQHLA